MTFAIKSSVLALAATCAGLAGQAHGQGSWTESGEMPTELLVQNRIDGIVAQMHGLPSDASATVMQLEGAPESAYEILRFDYEASSGRFAGLLATTEDGNVGIRGRAAIVVPVSMPVRRISPGEIISESDLAVVAMPVNMISSAILREDTEIVGKEAKRALAAERPIQGQSLVEPRAVRKGETVEIAFRGELLNLSAPGKALQDGAIGDVLRVVNTASQKTISAEVIAPGQVAIATGRQTIGSTP